MKLTHTASIIALLLGLGTLPAMAADTTLPAGLPMKAPATPEANLGTNPSAGVTANGAMVSRKAAKPLAAEQLVKGLSGLKATRGGKVMEIPLAPRLQMMLRTPVQQGKIKPGPSGGGDKFTQVTKTTDYPYTTMGMLGNGCSGAIVAKRFVLTAAFCLYDLKNKKFYDNLDFYPAISGDNQPFGGVKWKDAYIPSGYAETGETQFDFGLVVLDGDIGDQTGWFGFGDVEKFDFKQLTVTGYPWEGVASQTMWQTKCDIDAAEDNFVFYHCPGKADALAAMTGSPVWFKGKADDAWQIVAIHNYAQDDKKNAWWALRLNRANTETLLAWIDQANKGGGDQPDCSCDEQSSPE